MQLVPGTRLGLYEIVGLLGAGGMGEVYRAIDPRLDRQVAIKVLPEAVHTDPERTARFEREAKLLASLNHQNIASIHGLEHSNGEQFIVMELVEGETLADQIARGPIPVLEALQIAKHIADALEAAHERGIIHRDLKPANVKVRPNGTVKVLDFGLAKALGGDPLTSPGTLTNSPTITSPVGVTGVGTLLGTAAYMAPEQARGKPVDKRADIWAFGCVLFEMVTSRRAFPGDDVSQTLARVIEREPDWDALPSGISTAIRLFLQRCLAKDPARRIRDIGDMRLALDGAFDAGVAYAPAGATFPSRSRRHALLLAAGVALSALVGLAVWQLRPVPSKPVTRFEVPLPNSGSSPGGHPVSISPDGQSVFYVENLDGRSRILRRDLADLSWGPVPGTDGAETAPFFQPDGPSMGFVTDSGRAIRAVLRSGGSVLPVVRTADSIYSPVWAPDGTIIFGSNSGIWRVAAGGGTAELIAKTNVTAAGAHVLPGGERVVFHVNAGGTAGEAYSIEVLTIATGERRKITDGMYPLYAAGQLIFIRSNNSVWSIPFDVDRAERSGSLAPIPLNIFRRAGDVPLALGNNGTLVYIPGFGTLGNTLTWVDARGNDKPTDISGEEYITPRLSPDGKKLAVGTRAGEIWVIDLERSTRTKIASSDRGGTHLSDITAWTPDSLRVTFNGVSQDLAAPRAPTLDWRLADASRPAEVIIRLEGNPTSWARNGTVLAYSCPQAALGSGATPNASANRDICVVQRSSTITASPWLATPANEQAPMFSPDGRWIAYVSDDSGQNQVYVQSYPGLGQRHTVSRDGGVEPVWARNGRELFYRSGNKMMAVSVGEGPSVTLGPPRVVFDRPFVRDASPSGAYPAYDVSTDGRFLMVALRSPDRLVVVQNWLEELKRLVPTK